MVPFCLRPNARDLMERIDAVYRELDDTENSPELTGQAGDDNTNTQEEEMLAVVQEDPEPIITPEPNEEEDVSNTGATNQPEDSRTAISTSNMSTPQQQRIEALKVWLAIAIKL